MNRSGVVLVCTVAMFASSLHAQPQQNFAADAYKRLQSLAGDWVGKDEQGEEVKSNFKPAISNTVVMETLNAGGMEEMLTLYSVDGDGISLLHYCPTNNQPHMRAVPRSGDVKELTFSFLSAGNLPSIAGVTSTRWCWTSKTRITSRNTGLGGRMARTWRWCTTWRGSSDYGWGSRGTSPVCSEPPSRRSSRTSV